jgi:LysR family transcriptional activator of nhaA
MTAPVELNYRHLHYFWVVAREGSVAAAAGKLHLSQPTISMQLKQLQRSLKCRLFQRDGRRLALTDQGQRVLAYANQIFAAGQQLADSLQGIQPGVKRRLVVGVPDAMPKILTFRLLQPALKLPEQFELECYEAKFDQLLADLAVDRFDVVLSDSPLGVGARVRAFNHPLGECGIAICGTAKLAARYRRRFPQSLDGAPMLLPTPHTDMRRSLDQWFDARRISPQVVAEFDDSALMKEFGLNGAGLFPVPLAVLGDVRRQYKAVLAGKLEEVRARYFAITPYRRLKHPAVAAICAAAPTLLE